MAYVDRLYPPNIAGTLPSFYTELDGTTKLVVPFSMNQSVSAVSVKGFYLRLKRTTTDTLLSVQHTSLWDAENFTVTFNLSENTVSKMTTGDYYKVQIAYYNLTPGGQPYCGHYSTVAIVKYTEQPNIEIQSLLSGRVNSVSSQQFVGRYSNPDISEKVYQYRFSIKSSYMNDIGVLVEKDLIDTGWLIHDSTSDTELTASTDLFVLSELLERGITYTILYRVITNNGLQIESPQYIVVAVENLGEILPCHLSGKLDYENARVRLTTHSIYPPYDEGTNIPSEYKNRYYFNGNYQIVRTDSKSNFKTWTLVYTFQSYSLFENWEYYDYIVESGVAYKYGLQRINANNIRSARKETVENIVVHFEDSYFYDGERQLRINLNANVSSIKTVTAESKKVTLGNKYPYILRNGYLSYKEFPITGVLTYLSDPNELFITKEELIHPTVLAGKKEHGRPLKEFVESTDQTDENITAEKNFAMSVLSWLNNGSIKLFKSSQEGNYIIKCLNVSLTPLNNTNRMIHNFQCTVDEVQEYTTTALLKYNLLNLGNADEEGHVWDPQDEDIEIHKVREGYQSTYRELQRIRPAFAQHDFTYGRYITRIEIDSTPGDLFQYGDYQFAIPQMGHYTIINAQPLIQPLRKIYIVTGTTIDNGELIDTVLPQTFGQFDEGHVHIYYNVDTSIDFETVSNETVKTYYGWSAYGMEAAEEGRQSDNILWEFAGPKKTIINEYEKSFHSYPRYAATNVAAYANVNINYYGTRFGGYLQLQETGPDSNGEFYIYDKDQQEFVEQTLPDLNIRLKSPTSNLIQIKEKSTEGVTLPDINYLDKDEVYCTIGTNIFAIFYLQVQETTYALESTNSAIANNKAEAEAAKKLYYKYLWNFEEIDNRPQDDTQVYVYSDDRFSLIAPTEWDNYNEHFRVKSTTYTREQIEAAYTSYYQKEKAFEDLLQFHINNGTGG